MYFKVYSAQAVFEKSPTLPLTIPHLCPQLSKIKKKNRLWKDGPYKHYMKYGDVKNGDKRCTN